MVGLRSYDARILPASVCVIYLFCNETRRARLNVKRVTTAANRLERVLQSQPRVEVR
jgi:hypothetical protein